MKIVQYWKVFIHHPQTSQAWEAPKNTANLVLRMFTVHNFAEWLARSSIKKKKHNPLNPQKQGLFHDKLSKKNVWC
jgi:hypothetical protein